MRRALAKWRGAAIGIGLIAVATPALAQDKPDDLRFCPNRPSLEESACTVDPGHVLAEMSLFDWTLDRQPGSREDTILSGDLQLRLGLTPNSEVQLGWTAFGHDRLRDTATGMVDRASGVGDVRIGYRRNLSHADGKGFSIAVEPYATLPAGGKAIGAGTWGAGAVLPASYELSDLIDLQFTGSLNAAPDEDRHGRHLSYAGDWGVGFQLTPKVDLVTEVQVTADDDPSRHTTQSIAAVSLAYQPKKRWQIDALVGAGLNHATPDVRFLTGGAVLF